MQNIDNLRLNLEMLYDELNSYEIDNRIDEIIDTEDDALYDVDEISTTKAEKLENLIGFITADLDNLNVSIRKAIALLEELGKEV